MTTWTSLRSPFLKVGSQRAVDEPAGEDRVLARAALAAEERAGDLPDGVHPLLDVDGEREEVEVLLRVLAGGRRRQQHRLVVEVRRDGPLGLTGQQAGLELDGAGAERAVVDDGLYGGDDGSLHGDAPFCSRRRTSRGAVTRGRLGAGLLRVTGAGLRSRPAARRPPDDGVVATRGPLPRTGQTSAVAPDGFLSCVGSARADRLACPGTPVPKLVGAAAQVGQPLRHRHRRRPSRSTMAR